MKRVIVTICREFGAEGHEIGKILGERLGIPMYDKQLLEMSAKESGLPLDRAAAIDEKASDRLLSNYMPLGSDALNDQLVRVESNLIKQLADKGSCIIVGRLSDYVLRDEPDAVKVLITAPFEKRVEIIRDKHQITGEAAKKLVKKMDAARSAYYSRYTNGKWCHETEKDVILNRGTFGVEGCANILEGVIRKRMA